MVQPGFLQFRGCRAIACNLPARNRRDQLPSQMRDDSYANGFVPKTEMFD